MPANPPDHMTRITPYLYYKDVASALEWLARAFGFEERMRMPGPDGEVMHAEMEYADGVIMLGCPTPDYRNPTELGQATSLYVFVDDVDGHFRQAKESGARILEEPEDQFTVTDATRPKTRKGTTGTLRSMCATWRQRT